MNDFIADNRVSTIRNYLKQELKAQYQEREADNIALALFYHFSKWSRAEVILFENECLSESQLLKYHFALKRLKNGEPLQHVTGVSYFYGLTLSVNASVLIPRPETEELVSLILEKNKTPAPSILDLCTGSGCIAIALKKNLVEANILAVDISKEALEIAKKNAVENNTNIEFLEMNMLNEKLPQKKFDIIASNPPYVLRSDAKRMHTNVIEFEPHIALFVEDTDALIFYRKIIEISKTNLTENGTVFCEIHEEKENVLTMLLQSENIHTFSFHNDIQNKKRFLIFQP